MLRLTAGFVSFATRTNKGVIMSETVAQKPRKFRDRKAAMEYAARCNRGDGMRGERGVVVSSWAFNGQFYVVASGDSGIIDKILDTNGEFVEFDRGMV